MGSLTKYLSLTIAIALIVDNTIAQNALKFRFKNINCTSHDETFIKFLACYVKAVDRDTNYITVKQQFFKLPIKSHGVHLKINYRANGWRPFLYDLTIDICKFLRHANTPIGKLLFDVLQARVKLACPIKDKIQTYENLTNKHISYSLRRLPVPPGYYVVRLGWYHDNMTVHSSTDVFYTVD